MSKIHMIAESGQFPVMVALLLSCVALLLLYFRFFRWRIKKKKIQQGIPGYVLFYADQKGGTKGSDFGKLLYASRYDLQGKPDYIFKRRWGRHMVPVEIKSGTIGADSKPHPGDRLQLATYFLIIEDVYGVRPRYGRLLYRDAMFVIRNTGDIRREVRRTVARMRKMLRDGQGVANNSYVTCRHCLCKDTVCKFSQEKK